jgi:DNA-binding response OmpR family regulator
VPVNDTLTDFAAKPGQKTRVSTLNLFFNRVLLARLAWGYELLKQVRADPVLSTTPFIMVTAESKTENVIAAKQAGVNNYIVKPFNAETLKNKIDAVFLTP